MFLMIQNDKMLSILSPMWKVKEWFGLFPRNYTRILLAWWNVKTKNLNIYCVLVCLIDSVDWLLLLLMNISDDSLWISPVYLFFLKKAEFSRIDFFTLNNQVVLAVVRVSKVIHFFQSFFSPTKKKKKNFFQIVLHKEINRFFLPRFFICFLLNQSKLNESR